MKKYLLSAVFILAFTGMTVAQVSLTATVGTLSGSYTTLKGAFDKINDGTHRGVIAITITANTTEAASPVLMASGTGSASYSSVSIQPSGGGARTVSGTIAGSLVYLNGADYVTIDGLNSGGNSLTFENSSTSTSASTMRFGNGATYNTITNCSIKGSTGYNNANSVVTFAAGANTNNLISYCNVGPSGSNKPWACIISGSDGSSYNNANNTVDHCNLYDFVGGSGVGALDRHSGIYFYFQTTTGWTITNNSFYQTSTVNTTDGIVAMIHIRNGDGYTITGNYFGGSSPQCGGTAMTYTGSVQRFYCIEFAMSTGTTNTNTITGNYFQNISVTTSTATNSTNSTNPRFSIIYLGNGKFNICNNTIGRTDQNGNITYSQTGTAYSLIPLINGAYSPGTITLYNFMNNVISGVTIDARYFDGYGLMIDAGAIYNISNNLFGSLTQANSISISLATASVTRSYFTMIYACYGPPAGRLTIDRNIVSNVSRGTGSADGLTCLAGAVNSDITNNLIQNVSSANTGAVYGISHGSASDVTFVGNTIKNLSGSGTLLYGLRTTSGTTSIKQNYIAALKTTSSSTIYGILANNATNNGNIINNLVSLGLSDDGSSLPNYNFYGIYIDNTGTSNIYFNSIYIGGTGTSGSSSSYAFTKSLNSGTTNIKDNIFSNFRANSGGTGSHYAVSLAGNTNLTINYNNYYAPNSGGILGRFNNVDKTTLAAWKTSTGQDVNSVNINPAFVNPSGAIASSDYNLGETSGCIGTGTDAGSVTIDILGAVRPNPVGSNPDIGAYESPLSAATTDYTWTGSVSNNWATEGNWSPEDVPDENSKVTIGTGGTPIVDEIPATPATCYNLTIASGATLTINAGKALTVSGTLTNNAGSAALIVESDATGTGSLIANSSGIGATVKQYMTGSGSGDSWWHLISSPISDGLSGIFINEYLMYYDESAHTYTYIVPTDVSLVPMKGYAVWTTTNVTKSFTGTLNNGSQSLTLSRTWNTSAFDGWNLVGNPFPCALDVTYASRTNVETSCYFWDPSGSGNYKVWVPGGGETHSKYAPPMQGFFVHCTGSGTTTQAPPESGLISVTNTAKTHLITESFYKTTGQPDLLRISVTGDVNSYSDELSVYFNPDLTSKYESGFDALKFNGNTNAPQIYTVTEDLKVTVNALSFIDNTATVTMGFFTGQAGNYTLTASNLVSFSSNSTVMLEDLKLGITVNLKQNPNYTFAYQPGDDPERFLLHFFSPSVGIAPSSDDGVQIYSHQNTIYIRSDGTTLSNRTVTITDMLGREMFSKSLSNVDLVKINPRLTSGYYIVKVVTPSGLTTKKVFLN